MNGSCAHLVRNDRVTAAVIGEHGRLGRTVMQRLPDVDASIELLGGFGRYQPDAPEDFNEPLRRALDGVDVLVNVAGKAHLPAHPAAVDVRSLAVSNVALPLDLGQLCLETTTSLIHVSSSKARNGGRSSSTGYAWSKRLGDAALVEEFDRPFRSKGLSLVIVRPPALLVPPLDTGRLRHLRHLPLIPEWLVPRRRVPALSGERFVEILANLIVSPGSSGVVTVDIESTDLADLRLVRAVMNDERHRRSTR